MPDDDAACARRDAMIERLRRLHSGAGSNAFQRDLYLLRMAKEAGLEGSLESLKRFAGLVRADYFTALLGDADV